MIHRNLKYFQRQYGHRIVPIEVGIMNDKGGMKEKMITIDELVRSFLIPSTQKICWPLSSSDSGIAYLAQHELFNQIPELMESIEPSPRLCGNDGPVQMNVWMGTGGTRTPLHFDSFDNLFVQIVGAKYVRLYGIEETEKLYVIRGKGTNSNPELATYGKQGNMSAIKCEIDDFVESEKCRFPKAKEAIYREVVMFPGDCLFIPARVWHYVRSLSTSISVNYWW